MTINDQRLKLSLCCTRFYVITVASHVWCGISNHRKPDGFVQQRSKLTTRGILKPPSLPIIGGPLWGESNGDRWIFLTEDQ